jgi:multidrug efflux pump subunit AcrB
MKTIAQFIYRNPWVYIVLAFMILLGAWSALISIAVKHTPQQIEVKR